MGKNTCRQSTAPLLDRSQNGTEICPENYHPCTRSRKFYSLTPVGSFEGSCVAMSRRLRMTTVTSMFSHIFTRAVMFHLVPISLGSHEKTVVRILTLGSKFYNFHPTRKFHCISSILLMSSSWEMNSTTSDHTIAIPTHQPHPQLWEWEEKCSPEFHPREASRQGLAGCLLKWKPRNFAVGFKMRLWGIFAGYKLGRGRFYSSVRKNFPGRGN